MVEISSDVLRTKIKGLLTGADLDKVTAKVVRKTLEDEFKCDLGERKKEISDIISNIINDESSASSSSDDSDSGPEDKHSIKKSNKDKKKQIKKDTKKESSSSSDAADDDEEIARRLQEEEAKGGRRTRNGGSSASKKKVVKKKSSKRKNSDSDDEDGDKKKKKGTGFGKPLPLSEDLADFMGEPEVPRHAVVKRIWDYCKENNLLDPKNKQFAICDEKLHRVFGVKRFRMFGMMKLLSKHFLKEN